MTALDYDIFMVIGIVLLILSIPSVISALTDGHAPRVASILVLIGGVLVVIAVTQHPGAYTLADVPRAFVRVIGHVIH